MKIVTYKNLQNLGLVSFESYKKCKLQFWKLPNPTRHTSIPGIPVRSSVPIYFTTGIVPTVGTYIESLYILYIFYIYLYIYTGSVIISIVIQITNMMNNWVSDTN